MNAVCKCTAYIYVCATGSSGSRYALLLINTFEIHDLDALLRIRMRSVIVGSLSLSLSASIITAQPRRSCIDVRMCDISRRLTRKSS